MRRREFLHAASSGILGAGVAGAWPLGVRESTAGTATRAAKRKRRVLCNDDGHIMSLEPPLTVDHLRRLVRNYKGTPVDALFWCGGDREVYTYDTKVGEVFGRRHASFNHAGDWRVYQNTKSFIESGKCVLATLVEVCHEEGLEIFPSVRMNSHYKTDPKSPNESQFRLDHPEWLIGYPAGYSEGSKEYAVRMGLNYARPEVRKHMAAIIAELFERFEVDGVEMDFMRHPVFFKFHEAFENRHHMTNMLRQIKHRRDEVSRARGKTIDLAVRVPPGFAAALRVGLDVRTWIKEGLVDLVVGGGGFIPFDMPFEEFVDAARGTGCQIYGCLEGAHSREEEVLRAIAMRYWKAGADGLYLFNLFARWTEWQEAALVTQVADRGVLAGLDKRYQIDRRRYSAGTPDWSALGGAFDGVTAPAQLPVQLDESPEGMGAVLKLAVADDLNAAKSRGKLKETLLRLEFDDNHTSQDAVEVKLNGQALAERRAAPFRAGTLEYETPIPPLCEGANQIEVRLVKRTPKLASPLILRRVEIAIRYQKAGVRQLDRWPGDVVPTQSRMGTGSIKQERHSPKFHRACFCCGVVEPTILENFSSGFCWS